MKKNEIWWCVKRDINNDTGFIWHTISINPEISKYVFTTRLNKALSENHKWEYFEKQGYKVVKIKVEEV